MTALRIGCSGWAYRDWVGPFYPKGTKANVEKVVLAMEKVQIMLMWMKSQQKNLI